MGRRLNGTVVMRDPDGAPVAFYAGDELPAWADKLVTNTDLFDEDDAPAYPDGDPAGSWKVPELKAWAEAQGIDLEGATRKGDILAAIGATAPPADDGDPTGDEGDGDDAGGDDQE